MFYHTYAILVPLMTKIYEIIDGSLISTKQTALEYSNHIFNVKKMGTSTYTCIRLTEYDCLEKNRRYDTCHAI